MMTKKPPGLLISFDGVDSSGKETQTNLLIARLQAHGFTVRQVDTPDYDTPSGQELKRRLQDEDGTWGQLPWQEKMRMFAANRQEHRAEVLAALEAGEIVVYDRYVPSSLAFMAVEALRAQEVELKRAEIYAEVEKEEYERRRMPRENLSIFLDMPPTISSQLLTTRKAQLHEADEYTDRFEIQQRLYNEYDFMCNEQPQRFARIQCVLGNEILDRSTVSELVWEALIVNFPKLNSHA